MILESLHLDDHALRVQTDCGLVRIDEFRDEWGRLQPQILIQGEAGFRAEARVETNGTVVIRLREGLARVAESA